MKKTYKNISDLVIFDDYYFDRETNELFFRGKKIALRYQAAKMLSLLLQTPGKLISRQTIIDYLWPDTHVDFEQRIRSSIMELRAALNDTADNPRFLETVSKQGYRFIHPVKINRKQTKSKKTNWAVVSIIIAIGITVWLLDLFPKSIQEKFDPSILVVLPVQDTSVNNPDVYLADSLTHDLIANLVREANNQVSVIGRISAMKYKGQEVTLQEIRERLGADFVLESTLANPDNRFNLTTTLIETESQTVVWSGDFANIKSQLKVINEKITNEVLSTLAPKVIKPITFPAPPTYKEASYDAYLKGVYFYRSEESRDLEKSLAYFTEASNLDPNFAAPLVGKARIALALDEDFRKAHDFLDQAISLDESLGEAFFLKGWINFLYQWDWAAAEENITRAISLNPGNVEFRQFYSAFLRAQGKFDESLAHALYSLTQDPLAELSYRDLSFLYLSRNQFQNAIDICMRGLELELRNISREYHCIMMANLGLKNLEQAALNARKIMVLGGASGQILEKFDSETLENKMTTYWTWKLNDLASDPPPRNFHFESAKALTALGNFDEAFIELEKALNEKEFGLLFMLGEYQLKPLREDNRFLMIARQVGFPSV